MEKMIELMKIKYDLKRIDIIVLFYIIKSEEGLTIEQLTTLNNKTRTLIQKSIKRLMGHGLIQRIQDNQIRGYNYRYLVEEKNKLLRLLEKILLDDHKIAERNLVKNFIENERGLSKLFGITREY